MIDIPDFIEIPLREDFQRTGTVEHTELTDVDRAVAAYFQNVLDALTVADTQRVENLEFVRFIKKPKNQKIYFGDFSDPLSFVKKLADKVGSKIKQEKNELLPTSYISRDPSIVFSESNEYIDISECGSFVDQYNVTIASLNKSFVLLTYNVTLLAWNKATLSRMALGLMMYQRHKSKLLKPKFTAKTKLAGGYIELNIEVKSVKDAMTTPEQIDYENQRLFASSISFEILSEVYEAEKVNVRHSSARLSLRGSAFV